MNTTNLGPPLQARRLGHNYIGAEHLLLGLIKETEGTAIQVLEKMGVDKEKIKYEVWGPLRAPARQGNVLPPSDSELLGLCVSCMSPASSTSGPRVILQTIKALADQSKESTLAGVGTGASSKGGSDTKDPTLAEFTVNLTEKAAQGLLDPVIGRKHEIERVTQILGMPTAGERARCCPHSSRVEPPALAGFTCP